jgi:DNA-directed RNA polymerase specialized sigma24 family protein
VALLVTGPDFWSVMRVEHKPQPAGGRAAPATGTLAAADDAALFAAVAALSVEAVKETYDRHATALCSLALLITEDPELAEDAVAGAFIALWRTPSSICLEQQSLRAALAGEVYTRCTQGRETRERAPGQRAKTYRDPQLPARADLALLPRSQRDLLALILLGEHNRRQAARRVGLNEATAARMITGALRTRRQVEGKPRPSVTAATGGTGALVSSMTLRRSMTH